MKVMSYNTLFGGWDGLDGRRFGLQREIIATVRPDVLLVQEAKQFERDGNKRLYEVEQAIEMRGFLAQATRTGQNTVVFIGDEIRPMSFDADCVHFHHSAAVLTVRSPEFALPLTLVSVHLCPNGPQVRQTEAAYLIGHAAPDGLALIGGDFNSVSSLDAEPPDWEYLPTHFRARYLSSDGKTADRSVMEGLYRAGFIDVAHRFGEHREATVPGAAFKNTEFVPFRSDYLLASAALATSAASYAVIKDENTHAASDHYPIVAEFIP
jgi:exodeoxyribonuclease-3